MDALLTPNDQMEALSRVYVRAIAARAGYTVGQADLDRDSVDLFVQAGGSMRPQIGVQLKSTTTIDDTDNFSFPIPIKNYNDLRIQTIVPRLLIVFVMPRLDRDWLDHNIDRLIVKKCAYWASLAGMGDTSNTTSVSIQIEFSKIFNVAALVAIMDKARRGEPL